MCAVGIRMKVVIVFIGWEQARALFFQGVDLSSIHHR